MGLGMGLTMTQIDNLRKILERWLGPATERMLDLARRVARACGDHLRRSSA